jgi:hypothetical protein
MARGEDGIKLPNPLRLPCHPLQNCVKNGGTDSMPAGHPHGILWFPTGGNGYKDLAYLLP